MTRKKYLLLLAVFVAAGVGGVGLISYWLDPAGTFHSHGYGSGNSADEYAQSLIRSKHGLLWPEHSWNLRDIKSHLARQGGNFDCFVIGSSRAMQISSFRKPSPLSGLCKSVRNLAVAGAGLEDYLALSLLLLRNKDHQKTVVFDIDPWVLDLGRDGRWQAHYFNLYWKMREILGGKGEHKIGKYWRLLTNLINPEYFLTSLKQIGRAQDKIQAAPAFDFSVGIDDPVLLPDGSTAYSKGFIAHAKSTPVPSVIYYKYDIKDGKQINEAAVSLFERLIVKLKESGFRVVFLMVPYHPNVWLDAGSMTVKALKEVEPRIRAIGKSLDVTVLGSYDPKRIGCRPDEFFDFMHPMRDCLIRIKN